MTLLLLCTGDALQVSPPSAATSFLLERLAKRADLPTAASADVVKNAIGRNFISHALPDDLAHLLEQALRSALGCGNAAQQAREKLALFAAAEPRPFEALAQKERPQGSFGGGVLAQLSIMIDTEK
ncbi:MAG: hypothetical protein GY822_03545 [Deltaproteobacteria bacterium]|nr:hypothetical protein [Deltaproteobacteria bacterium]